MIKNGDNDFNDDCLYDHINLTNDELNLTNDDSDIIIEELDCMHNDDMDLYLYLIIDNLDLNYGDCDFITNNLNLINHYLGLGNSDPDLINGDLVIIISCMLMMI